MKIFDIIGFQQRVQQANTPLAYSQLKIELAQYVSSLSAEEKITFREQVKPIWANLHSRVDALLDELSQHNPVAV